MIIIITWQLRATTSSFENVFTLLRAFLGTLLSDFLFWALFSVGLLFWGPFWHFFEWPLFWALFWATHSSEHFYEHSFEWPPLLSTFLSCPLVWALFVGTLLSRSTLLSAFLRTQKSGFAQKSNLLSGFTILSAFLSTFLGAQAHSEPLWTKMRNPCNKLSPKLEEYTVVQI